MDRSENIEKLAELLGKIKIGHSYYFTSPDEAVRESLKNGERNLINARRLRLRMRPGCLWWLCLR